VIDTVPSNVTALQDIVKNNSNKATSSNISSSDNGSSTVNTPATSSSSSSSSATAPQPQDLIPVVVNMTENTNASDLAFMRVINSTPGLETVNLTGSN
ncbi:MAG: hypothetical protein M3Y25_09185, partial [Thermoproteota archaeon]|nr:hypothetical protein [Thermoproteota archaeon]